MPISREASLYPIVHIETASDWDLLANLTENYLSSEHIHRFRTLLGKHCRTIIVERDYVDKDYRDTYHNFYAKKFAAYPKNCVRLLFFGDAVEAADWWEIDAYKLSFLGYSVIRPTRVTPIGRTVLDPTVCDGVTGYLCLADYSAHLFGCQLVVKGFPYISQDTDVTICAHATCWMIFRYYSERYPNYPEIHPYGITQLTTDLSYGRLLPSSGLNTGQILEICSRFGLYPVIYDKSKFSDGTDASRFLRLLYFYIESGLPVVIDLKDHAVAGIGHTLDFRLNTGAECSFSADYMTGILINDDNFLPYRVITDGINAVAGVPSTYTFADIESFIVPLPEKVYLFADQVENHTLAVLTDPEVGIRTKSSVLTFDQLVIRIFLTSSRAYKQERRGKLPFDLDQTYAQLPMPRFIWVSELSTRETYIQGEVLGEIIWDGTASARERLPWIVIHYPELLIVNDRNNHVGTKAELQFTSAAPARYPLYHHNLHAV